MMFTKKLLGSPVVNRHIAEITGQRNHIRPYIWRRGKEAYSHITGGIVLPTFGQQGFLLTVGVDPEGSVIHSLHEFESDDPYKIIQEAQAIQKQYGHGVIKTWWGDPTTLMSILNEVNIEGNPVLISQPVDFEASDSFPLYVARLKTALVESNKTFYLNRCILLQSHIQSFVQDKMAKAESNPAVALAGAVIHTLLVVRPWEQSVEVTELVPTTHEDYAAYENEQAMKALEQELYE